MGTLTMRRRCGKVDEEPSVIIYTASEKLAETTSLNASGLHTNAFDKQITSHTFEDGVGTIEFNGVITDIGEKAFYSCSSLTSIAIPNSVINIGVTAFYDCSYLTSVQFDGVKTIERAAFGNCTRLTSITIPNSVTSIGNSVFQDCVELTSITIPNSVTSIGTAAFLGCYKVEDITVDGNNTYYDSRNSCNAIIETSTNTLIVGCKNTVIPNTVTGIGATAFYKCQFTSLIIPNSVISIGERAFFSSYLQSVNIPSGVTSLPYSVFDNCTRLTSVTIPSSVTSIANSVFYYCTSLTSITIPSSVKSIGSSAFSYCSSLAEIICYRSTAPSIQANTFRSVKKGGTLKVPKSNSGYNTWMGTGNYYLGLYNWTKSSTL